MNADDERARIKERERGAEAQRIFDSIVWQESYEKVANGYLAQILDPKADDESVIESKRRLLALHAVKRNLATVLETGQMAAEQLEAAKNGG